MIRESRDPTYDDVLAAREHVYRHVRRTPLLSYLGLSACVGADVYVKHENHHAVGAFKVRGGLNLAAHLTKRERRAGLFTASTGNHGLSIAFAGKVTGTAVRVAVPEGANPAKVAAMRGLGAEVVAHGRDFDEAREWIECEAARAGVRFIGAAERVIRGNEPSVAHPSPKAQNGAPGRQGHPAGRGTRPAGWRRRR